VTREVDELRQRLTLLGEASLRINETLDVDAVMQSVIESARALTGAHHGVILRYSETGAVLNSFWSGMTPEQADGFWTMPDGYMFHDHLLTFDVPIRLSDLRSQFEQAGLPEFRPPLPLEPPVPFMAAPVLYRGDRAGALYLAGRSEEFTADDEETLRLLAAQAALVISHARQLRDEQRARANLESLLNTAPVGVLVLDATTTELTSVNREATRLAGDLVKPGTPIQVLLNASTVRTGDERQEQGTHSDLGRALASAETVRAEEIVIDAPDGRSITALVNATPVHGDGDTVESTILTLQDMTPLEELERLRAEFLGMVGHELRTPITSIKGSAITLLESQPALDPAEVVEYHRIIYEQADFMRGLITDLIDIVRIETGTLSIAPEPLNVTPLLDEARNHFLSSGGRDTIRINVAAELPAIMADRRRIVQVINNLLINADRNSHETSIIRLDAVHEGTHVAVSITDHGRGVSAERMPYLFRKFSRDASNPAHDLGLGLAICKGIVEAHGGRIWAESDGPGLGSRFTFTLPSSEEAPAEGLQSLAGAGPDDTIRVLVIDDDPRHLKLVRDALNLAGYEPIVTGDPSKAADIISEFQPGVVLMDLMLPGIDGIELMRSILDANDVPVIFLSAYDQQEAIARAFEMGAVDYIVKPFAPTELAARVRAALRKQPRPPNEHRVGDLEVNLAGRTVQVGGRSVDLTPMEFGVLAELAANPGSVLTHEALLQRVWGRAGDARPLRTVVKNLRQKLADPASRPRYIQTIPHVGYRMPEVSDWADPDLTD